MIEHHGDLFECLFKPGHIIGISTNGYVKKNGEGVMGRGCARSASIMFHDFPRLLGQHIRINGNVPGFVTVGSGKIKRRFIVLPVKHNWYEKADLALIQKCVDWLGEIVVGSEDGTDTIHVPRLGCGNGHLDWISQVQPLMAKLGDNVWVHH